MVSFDFRSIIIGITALGICIVTSSLTVVLMKGRRKSSMYYMKSIHVVLRSDSKTNNEEKTYFNVIEINYYTPSKWLNITNFLNGVMRGKSQ